MKRKISFTSDTGQLAQVRSQAGDFLAECGFSECEAALLILAIDEACTNIIRHAYHHECRPIRIQMERMRERVRFVIRDYGRSCDPQKIRSRPLEEIRPGGVGVHIIRQAFDLVRYEPQARGTRLTLEKKVPSFRRGLSHDG